MCIRDSLHTAHSGALDHKLEYCGEGESLVSGIILEWAEKLSRWNAFVVYNRLSILRDGLLWLDEYDDRRESIYNLRPPPRPNNLDSFHGNLHAYGLEIWEARDRPLPPRPPLCGDSHGRLDHLRSPTSHHKGLRDLGHKPSSMASSILNGLSALTPPNPKTKDSLSLRKLRIYSRQFHLNAPEKDILPPWRQ